VSYSPNQKSSSATFGSHYQSLQKELYVFNKLFEPNNVRLLAHIDAKIKNCGLESNEFVSSNSPSFFYKPCYCDNRCCSHLGCHEHRYYKYMSTHESQIESLDKNIKKPKAFIFTYGHISLENLSREFLQYALNKLVNLLYEYRHPNHGSPSAFSVHMELKMSVKYPSSAYLHFHVVAGGVGDIRFMESKWGRVVRYQHAIKKNGLSHYISKYACKTPRFPSELHQQLYSVLVYKLQMHRFCLEGYILVKSVIPESPSPVFGDGVVYDHTHKNWIPPPGGINLTKLLSSQQKKESLRLSFDGDVSLSNTYSDRKYQTEVLGLKYPDDVPECVFLSSNHLKNLSINRASNLLSSSHQKLQTFKLKTYKSSLQNKNSKLKINEVSHESKKTYQNLSKKATI